MEERSFLGGMGMRLQVFVLCFMLFVLVSPASSAEGVIKFSEDPWPPYTFGEAGKAPESGIAVDIIDAIFQAIGLETDMKLYPWKRCLQQMESGERDALMLLGYSEERESYLVYSDLVIDVRDLVFFRKNHSFTKWNSIVDFTSLRFARPFGFQFGKEFEAAVARSRIKISDVKDDLQAFTCLAGGRVDAFICNEFTARLIFKEHPEIAQQCVAGEKPFKSGPLYMAFSKKSVHRSLVHQVNDTIKDLKANGTIDSIISKYLD